MQARRYPDRSPVLVLLLCGPLLGACQTVQSALNATRQKFGSFGATRAEIMVARVQDAREAQVEAKAQFETTYDLFKQLTGYKGGELEDLYEAFRSEIKNCQSHRTKLDQSVQGIESVSSDYFAQWGEELQNIVNPGLREKSQGRLEKTVSRYERLVASLEMTADMMTPVTTAFEDHVLFLKHDLNPHAIASLDLSVDQVEQDISELFAEMQSCIKQADALITSMSTHTDGKAIP